MLEAKDEASCQEPSVEWVAPQDDQGAPLSSKCEGFLALLAILTEEGGGESWGQGLGRR